ncbi:putative neurogenic locus notch like protein 2 [Rhexocercosporidium sp. MPI-PUGE-AT-0058]|nr:putative neurogenic locus notch like protein 2 [Rhexocercosporidium sp. MPI-PUGE-AT-0058]
MAGGAIEIDQPGNYPIVLSDALMGRAASTRETYTGIRYNHKPDPSPDSSHNSLHLQPSDSDPTNFDLSLKDNSERYSYQGVRTSGSDQYVLIFNPEKKHFVLHQVDSTFDMNLTSAPRIQDASKLRTQYPQIPTSKTQNSVPQRKVSKGSKKTDPTKAAPPRRKVEKPKKPKPAPIIREPTPEEEESDDSFTVEYPEAPSNYEYKSTPIFDRAVSEPSDEDEDAEGEEIDEEEERNQDVDHLKLPSPANNNAGQMSEEDMELDLEAELEQALNAHENDESDESEEE